jgi:hypothetical protein
VVHIARNVLSSVSASSMGEVAQDLKAIFKVRREKTSRAVGAEALPHDGRPRGSGKAANPRLSRDIVYKRVPTTHRTRYPERPQACQAEYRFKERACVSSNRARPSF